MRASHTLHPPSTTVYLTLLLLTLPTCSLHTPHTPSPAPTPPFTHAPLTLKPHSSHALSPSPPPSPYLSPTHSCATCAPSACPRVLPQCWRRGGLTPPTPTAQCPSSTRCVCGGGELCLATNPHATPSVPPQPTYPPPFTTHRLPSMPCPSSNSLLQPAPLRPSTTHSNPAPYTLPPNT